MALKPSSLPPDLACRGSSGLKHAVDLVAPVSTGSTCGCIGTSSITRRRNRATASVASQCTRHTDIRKSRRHETGIATVSARPTSLHCIAARRINHFVGVTREIINHIGHVARRRLTVDAGVVGEASRVTRNAGRSLGSRAPVIRVARDSTSRADCSFARWHGIVGAVVLAVCAGSHVRHRRRAWIARIRYGV